MCNTGTGGSLRLADVPGRKKHAYDFARGLRRILVVEAAAVRSVRAVWGSFDGCVEVYTARVSQ